MTSTIGVKKIQHTNGTQVMTFDTAGKISSDVSSTGNITTTGAVNTASINGGQIGGRRNIIINGAFQCWQRGTSFSSNVYGADRWKFYAPGSHAYTRSTDTPDSPNNFQYSASVGGSGDATGLTQFVESANAQALPSSGSNKVILSFYLKHTTNSGTAKITSVVGTLDSTDTSGASTNRSTQNHNTTTSWARYTHEMTGADLTTAVTNGLVVTIKHNGSGATVFLITGIQLEISSQVTPFEHRTIGEELQLCSRYYWRQYNSGSNVIYFRDNISASGQNILYQFPAPPAMRINAATVTCTLTENVNSQTLTYHQHGTIAVYWASVSGDNYLYSEDLSIDAEL